LETTFTGGAGHGSRDSIQPIICLLSQSDGGQVFRPVGSVAHRSRAGFCDLKDISRKIFQQASSIISMPVTEQVLNSGEDFLYQN